MCVNLIYQGVNSTSVPPGIGLVSLRSPGNFMSITGSRDLDRTETLLRSGQFALYSAMSGVHGTLSQSSSSSSLAPGGKQIGNARAQRIQRVRSANLWASAVIWLTHCIPAQTCTLCRCQAGN